MTDWFISRTHLSIGDVVLHPASADAHRWLRNYRETFGDESLYCGGIFVERSRDDGRLTSVLQDLRADGFSTFRRVV